MRRSGAAVVAAVLLATVGLGGCAGAPRAESGPTSDPLARARYTFDAQIPIVHVSRGGRRYENEHVFGSVEILTDGRVQLESSHGSCTSREPLRPGTRTVRITCGEVGVSFTPGGVAAPGRVSAVVRELHERRGQCRQVSTETRTCVEWDWLPVEQKTNRSVQAAFQRTHVEPDDGGDVVARLRWLSGCWVERRANGTTISEHWSAADGVLRGTSRTRRDNRIVESEVMRITQQGDDVLFHAEPSGQQPADFRAITVSDTLVAFENPTHDFPQRISYRRVGADSLHARVEGTTSRGPRQIDFRMATAATCE